MMQQAKGIYIIMGVSGCGKTTIGKLLARELGLPFFDGDDFHPPANVQKMSAGIPLNDEDRASWLHKLNELAKEYQDTGAVIACSALKETYREVLSAGLIAQPLWVYLEGSYKAIATRLQQRTGHFMPPALLRSQFDILEPPAKGIKVSIEQEPENIVAQICRQIGYN